jgi:hypothetical protein
MKEVLAGIVSSCQLHRFDNLPESKPRLVLRPTEEWAAPMIVGAVVLLCFPNGKEYKAKIRGFELRSLIPKDIPVAILIEEMPELDNDVPTGTKVFVEEKE